MIYEEGDVIPIYEELIEEIEQDVQVCDAIDRAKRRLIKNLDESLEVRYPGITKMHYRVKVESMEEGEVTILTEKNTGTGE